MSSENIGKGNVEEIRDIINIFKGKGGTLTKTKIKESRFQYNQDAEGRKWLDGILDEMVSLQILSFIKKGRGHLYTLIEASADAYINDHTASRKRSNDNRCKSNNTSFVNPNENDSDDLVLAFNTGSNEYSVRLSPGKRVLDLLTSAETNIIDLVYFMANKYDLDGIAAYSFGLIDKLRGNCNRNRNEGDIIPIAEVYFISAEYDSDRGEYYAESIYNATDEEHYSIGEYLTLQMSSIGQRALLPPITDLIPQDELPCVLAAHLQTLPVQVRGTAKAIIDNGRHLQSQWGIVR